VRRATPDESFAKCAARPMHDSSIASGNSARLPKAIAYEQGLDEAASLWPSFETPASGGLLRMRSCFAVKSWTLMVRSAACGASRTMKAGLAHTLKWVTCDSPAPLPEEPIQNPAAKLRSDVVVALFQHRPAPETRTNSYCSP
jgi:hypothetical protein